MTKSKKLDHKRKLLHKCINAQMHKIVTAFSEVLKDVDHQELVQWVASNIQGKTHKQLKS